MTARQSLDLSQLKSQHISINKDKQSRRAAKSFQAQSARESKQRDMLIQNQVKASVAAEELEARLRQHENYSKMIVAHTEKRHAKEAKQLSARQDRIIGERRILIQYQTRNLTEEQRGKTMKEFQFEVAHQQIIDKKEMDKLCELQKNELRQTKELIEFEAESIESMAALHSHQFETVQEALATASLEKKTEKDQIATATEAMSNMKMQSTQTMEIKERMAVHRAQLRRLKQQQHIRALKRKTYWDTRIFQVMDNQTIELNDQHQSSKFETASVSSVETDSGKDNESTNALDAEAKLLQQQHSKLQESIGQLRENLQKLIAHHQSRLISLKLKQREERLQEEDSRRSKLALVESRHAKEIRSIVESFDEEIKAIENNHIREIEFEGAIIQNETAALQERKLLNNLLDNIVDSVISIDPTGIIRRFK